MPRGIYKHQKLSEVAKKKLHDFWIGKKKSPESKLKLSISRRGVFRTEIEKKHMSDGHKRHPTKYWLGKHLPESVKKKMSESHIGRKLPESVRRNMSVARAGKNNPNYKGGITPLNHKIRGSIEYKLWRESIFSRDNFTCQKCGQWGGRLRAHHINNFSSYLSLRLAIDNGITLCNNCHLKFHNKYGRDNNTKEQLEEYLNKK